jgi:hypothetical protein
MIKYITNLFYLYNIIQLFDYFHFYYSNFIFSVIQFLRINHKNMYFLYFKRLTLES